MKRIKRIYKGMPVKDAKANLTVVVLAQDVSKGTRKDPSCCAFAQACKRLFNGDAIFYKKIAYVELPDADGERYVHRFSLPLSATKLIMEYDRTGKFPAGVGINLLSPRKEGTLDALRRYHHTYHKERNAIKRYKNKNGIKARKYTAKTPRLFDTSVRNGTGSMHLVSFRVENGE